MDDSFWKRGRVPSGPKTVTWPGLRQLAVQLGAAVLLLALWGAAFAGFIVLVDRPVTAAVAAEPATRAPRPTATQTLSPPTNTPSPTATATHTSTPTRTPTPTDTPQPGEPTPTPAPPTATPTPTFTATPTNTPAPTSTATETPPPEPAAESAESSVSFAADVLPIFESRCLKCHGGEKTEEGLKLTGHAEIMAGSWNGSVVEPGNVEDSYLVEQIVSGEMPKKEPRLLPSEIRAITEWVAAGAPDN